ncbi:ATP-binding protein [Candidatus Acetothermia bacterium]|nr:ATP-binding protein [Candidatus Acetothermia bacterium]
MKGANAVVTAPALQPKNILFQCLGCGRDYISQSGGPPANWISQHRCSLACREKWLIQTLKKNGVGHRFLQASFQNFEVSDQTRIAHEAALEAAGDLERGLFIYGSVGAGKTHLLIAMMRQMLESGVVKPHELRFAPILELLEEVKRSWNSPDATSIERFKRIDALFIDDLGMEIIRDWTFQLFLSVINYRYNEDLPTFISSNLSERELLDRYGSAVFSRLAQMCRIVKLEAPNYRMKRTAKVLVDDR